MKPPSKVQVGPIAYTVRFDSDAMKAGSANGVCLNDTATILLETGNDPAVEREVVLHEVLHALWARTGLTTRHDDGPSDSVGELIIQDLAGGLLDILRRNPKLLQYLTE